MTVGAILKVKGNYVATTTPDTTVHSVAWELKVKNIGALVVSKDGASILGIVSERDLVRGSPSMAHTCKLFPCPR